MTALSGFSKVGYEDGSGFKLKVRAAAGSNLGYSDDYGSRLGYSVGYGLRYGYDDGSGFGKVGYENGSGFKLRYEAGLYKLNGGSGRRHAGPHTPAGHTKHP